MASYENRLKDATNRHVNHPTAWATNQSTNKLKAEYKINQSINNHVSK
jgi:hypothetical protein